MSKHRCGLNYLLAASAVALGAPAVHADPVLEEVVVTAQKREENSQKTTISLEVMGALELEERGIASVADLGNTTPGLRLVPFSQSPNTLNIYIRGVGAADSQVTEDSPVGVYLNGVYIARPVGLGSNVVGLDRIEVLRGPQGTLYGRNTTGGAVNLITAKPTDAFGGSQLVGFGNYGAVRMGEMLNVPITDTFYARASLDWDRRDGWVKNTGAGRDFSAYDRVAGRVDLRWKPTDAFTADYSYDQSHDNYTATYYQIASVNPTYSFLGQQPNRVKKAALPQPLQGSQALSGGHTLTLALQTGIGEFKSISAYRFLRAHQYMDFSGNDVLSIFVSDPVNTTQHQISQEVQLVGSTDSKMFDYVAGVYYFKERATVHDRDVAFSAFASFSDVTAINTSYAAYGQLTARPAAESPWSLAMGVRYSKDKRQAKFIANKPDLSMHETQFSNTSPSVSLNYQYSDDLLLYAKATLGYKAGGFNFREGNFDTPFGPEKILTYEAGWKSEWMDHRLRLNNAFFWSNYKDIQLDVNIPGNPDPAATFTKNAGKARVYGIETELNYAATEALRLQLSYAYLYNRFLAVENEDPAQFHLVAAPRNTVAATVDYDIAQLPYGLLNTTVDYSYRSSSLTEPSIRQFHGGYVDHYNVTDWRMSLTGDDWIWRNTKNRVSLWVRNLFDVEYMTSPSGAFECLHAYNLATWGTPRTYGIDFKVSF